VATVLAVGALAITTLPPSPEEPRPIAAEADLQFGLGEDEPERHGGGAGEGASDRAAAVTGTASSGLLMRDGEPCVMQPPLTEVEMAEVLQSGYEAFFGHAPTANRLACGWAHCAFEHARGKKLFGNNLGHITTTGAWRGPTCFKTFTHRVGTNPDRWKATTQRFRMHPTLLAGAIDYWKLMHHQYPGVLIACDRGEALTAARELHRRHYFTGPEQRYVHSLAQLYLESLGTVIPKTRRPAWPIGPHPRQ